MSDPLDQIPSPLIDGPGKVALCDLLEDTDAPPWTHPRGDRLDPSGIARVDEHARLLVTEPPRWTGADVPDWLGRWLDEIWERVPEYRRRGPRPVRLTDTATASRADLAAAPESFVPDDLDLDQLLQYGTSGTAGAPVTVPSHPVAVARYYPTIMRAAGFHGVDVQRPLRGEGIRWLTVISQQAGGFVIPSWSSWLGALTGQVNLADHAWRRPGDRERFLGRHDPTVVTGDPVAFEHLADLDVELHPAVLVSSASALAQGLADRLRSRFDCPVVDLYSTTETGPIAASLPTGGHALFQPRTHVELLDDHGQPVPVGEVGEITVTGGSNPALPLVRYRTGDRARLERRGAMPVLVDLQGRAPVVFRRPGAGSVNSHSITVAVTDLAIARFAIHQHCDDSLTVHAPTDDATADAFRTVLEQLFGAVDIRFAPLDDDDKVLPFVVESP